MGVARIQFGARPTNERVGPAANRAGRPIVVTALLLVLMGAAAPAHNDPIATRDAETVISESIAVDTSIEPAASWAGFGGVAITEALSQKLELPSTGGVIVTFVHPEGPAARAGLHPKDVILRADGEPIEDGAAWSEWVAEQVPGTTIELDLYREDEALSVQLTIEELPAGLDPAGY